MYLVKKQAEAMEAANKDEIYSSLPASPKHCKQPEDEGESVNLQQYEGH